MAPPRLAKVQALAIAIAIAIAIASASASASAIAIAIASAIAVAGAALGPRRASRPGKLVRYLLSAAHAEREADRRVCLVGSPQTHGERIA